jgi:DNA-binding winged helix-turn-helix (wHTH) protein/Tol biopolymer transport system component
MAETQSRPRLVRFGAFEADVQTGELRKDGVKLKFSGQPFQVLAILLERPGDVVTREELQKRLWPDTFVDIERNLNTAVNKIREVLGDSAETPRFVETLPRRGYRFIAPVERESAVEPAVEIDTETGPLIGSAESSATEMNRASDAPRRVQIARWTGFAAACVFSLLLGWLAHTRMVARDRADGRSSSGAVRASILPPSSRSFEHSSFSVSPDGTRLAFVGIGPDGHDKLWVRAFSSSDAQQVNGTDGALLPFWAPDSNRIGFFAAGKLATVDLNNGTVRILCDAPFGRGGGTWGPDGTIVFLPYVVGPLYRIRESGGVAVQVPQILQPGPGRRNTWPSFLPDGRRFLYAESGGPNDPQGESIYVGSLDGGSPKLIATKRAGNAAYAAGYLVYGHDHILWAQPFDLHRLDFSGPAMSITSQELNQERSFSHAEFSVSPNGVLVFQSLSDLSAKLVWFDMGGKDLGQIDETGYLDPRLSPDGRLLAVSSDDERNGKQVISVVDLARGISTRLTDGGIEGSPAWSPDGKRIFYRTIGALKEVPADGSGPAHTIVNGGNYLGHMDWSADGHMVFTDFSGGEPTLKIYSASDGKVELFAVGAESRFSPDGKWIAYDGPMTTAGSAIFVASFPGPGGRIQVSTGSGAQPNWSHDGKHVFYVAPDRKLMMVDFNPRIESAGTPRVIFQTRIIAPNFAETQYAVSRDGRFLINSYPANASSPLTLMTGWTAQVRTRSD